MNRRGKGKERKKTIKGKIEAAEEMK